MVNYVLQTAITDTGANRNPCLLEILGMFRDLTGHRQHVLLLKAYEESTDTLFEDNADFPVSCISEKIVCRTSVSVSRYQVNHGHRDLDLRVFPDRTSKHLLYIKSRTLETINLHCAKLMS